METDQPRGEIESRARQRRATEAQLERLHWRYSIARLVVFGLGVALLVASVWMKLLSPAWLLAPIGAFIVLAVRHEDVVRARDRARRAAEFYERSLARIDDRWSGVGPTGERFLDPEHPYAIDLDLFGDGSLFQLLSQARTRAGEERLAAWLLAPAAAEVVRARQGAVRELASALDLREAIAVLGDEVESALHPSELVAWGSESKAAVAVDRVLALLLALVSVVTLVGWLAWHWGALPLVGAIALQFVLRRRTKESMRRARVGADHVLRDLRLLSEILGRVESERFDAPHLRRLHARVEESPARAIRALDRWVDGFEARRNALLAPVTGLLLLDLQCGLAIEAWRARHGHRIEEWLDLVAEFEALASLAAFACEQEALCYPEIPPRVEFDAAALGHPLLPRAACVTNDVRLDQERSLLVISGSNMSGKSTLLRTIGISTVLALAGAPVRARSLRVGELTLGASIRIVDSLQHGTSRFYAEVKRVRQIVALAEAPRPLLYLVDEIFQGTNSHDRRIGVEAILRSLVERGALGLITTHDLALTEIVAQLGPRARNVHFEDHLEGGRMAFDYRLRDGVVAKSNALELMRSVGLEV
ncbi:MAG: DNA mismatch repair protein MutS [Candidatus Eisenbacteria bacterium]